jgi:hypothetical protein
VRLGIVGAAAEKFDAVTRKWAKRAIREAIDVYKPTRVISGGCHMGGVDKWAVRIAKKMDVKTKEFPSTTRTWSGPGGFKERNLRIADECDLALCIVVEKLPEGFDGGVAFEDCYHCKSLRPSHCKSGGCWTAMQAAFAEWNIILPEGGILRSPMLGMWRKGNKLARSFEEGM